MLTKFWESAGEGLSARWLEQLFGPAFLFWSGGISIIVWKVGFYAAWNWISTRDVATQSVTLIVSLLVILLSGELMRHLRFYFLRMLEGYWVWPFNYLGLLFININWWQIKRERQRWNILMNKKEKGTLSIPERWELSNLEINGHYTPANIDDCMPTSFGNILRAAETAPKYKYGLDAVICWPRLWLLISKELQESLIDSRQRLELLVELFAWGLLFATWVIWWHWAILISIIWMVGAYILLNQSAMAYSDLIEATFDTQRFALYESVHWRLPQKTGKVEVVLGEQLTAFFWRGYSEKPITLTQSKE
ncbi:MAG TPA: hypothetical protein PKX08_19380 [Cyclobacteriaceae bacterium]|nr:hypothetical protein [Cyclobacteriaceae bacterium]